MAIVLQPKYPIPNRSDQNPNLTKDEYGVLDIGWTDGVLTDGRPFRAEMWAQDGISMLTIFFSVKDLVGLDQEQLQRLVESEGLVAFRPHAKTSCEARKHVDCAGSEMWSVNIVVGDEERSFLVGSVPVFPYSRSSEPNTMFNSIAIKAAHAVG